jgi:hypothetical protein
MKKLNKDTAFYLINQIEKLLVDETAEYPDALGATLFIAVVCANNLGMTKKMFMDSCEALFDSDKEEQMKGLQ